MPWPYMVNKKQIMFWALKYLPKRKAILWHLLFEDYVPHILTSDLGCETLGRGGGEVLVWVVMCLLVWHITRK